jgi:tRNA dimethylallyltransferase
MTKPSVLVIGGPTAIGKTDLAIEIASRLGGEIVNADSRQLYRGMDIGTAKPTAAERAAVGHHMVDVAAPDETFTLALYLSGARAAIDSIHARGLLPIVAGGTGLYTRALSQGFDVPEVPPNARLRAELEQTVRDHGVEAVAARLRDRDPAVADRVDTRNLRRLIRALEIHEAVGVMASGPPSRTATYDVLMFVLEMDREALFARASARLARMIDVGFISEIERLLASGYGLALPAMSALGYREYGRYLLGEMDLPAATAATEKSTRAFIRRQQTWFRGDVDATRLSMDQMGFLNVALRRIAAWRASPAE